VLLNLSINTSMVLGLTITFGPMFDKYLYDISHGQNRIVGVAESVSGMTSLVVFLPVAYLVDGSPDNRTKFVRW